MRLPISVSNSAGKLEGTVVTRISPVRSTVKLPEGSCNSFGADLENSVKKPIEPALSSSFRELGRRSWSVSSRHRTRYHHVQTERRGVAGRGLRFVRGRLPEAGPPKRESFPKCAAPTWTYAQDSPTLWLVGGPRQDAWPGRIRRLRLWITAPAGKERSVRPLQRQNHRGIRRRPGRTRARGHYSR